MIESKSDDRSPSLESGLTSLEQLHAVLQENEKCPSPNSPKLLGVNRKERRAIYVKAPCKMWSCPVCGHKKTAQWVARVLTGINYYIKHGSPDWYFMTITAHDKWRGAENSLENIRSGWRRLSNRMWRKFGKGHYVRIFEHHKDGSFHAHFLTDIKIPYTAKMEYNPKRERDEMRYRCRWLKDNARQCGMGYMDDYQPLLNPGFAAHYVAKYLTKSVGDAGAQWPKGVRRIQTSRGWPKLPPLTDASDYSWQFVSSRGELMLRAANLWRFEDILVTDIETGNEFTTDDFERHLR